MLKTSKFTGITKTSKNTYFRYCTMHNTILLMYCHRLGKTIGDDFLKN